MNRSQIHSRRRPKRSLRTLLLSWFLPLSLFPLVFLTGYSLVKFEQAIDAELIQRLKANAREVSASISEYERYLENRRMRIKEDSILAYQLSTGSSSGVRDRLPVLMGNSLVSVSSVFNRKWQQIAVLTRARLREGAAASTPSPAVFLSEPLKTALLKTGKVGIVDRGIRNQLDLIAITRIDGKGKRFVGAVEEVISLGGGYLENLKRRMGLEIILFDSKNELIAASDEDLLLLKASVFSKAIAGEGSTVIDLPLKSQPFGFLVSKVKWGNGFFYIGVGASKRESREVLKKVNMAFYTVTGAVGVLLVVLVFALSRVLLRPLNDLVEAIQSFQSPLKTDGLEVPVEIPVTTDTEIGLLTNSFNEMAQRIYQAKRDLKLKIAELEKANVDIREAQTMLVQSAKMASLGQLVAGVAHELNNPIGFVYSNMSTLKEYSTRLYRLIDVAEKTPDQLAQAKVELDYEYIVQDLPKLIASSEDGARRMRDIVVKLRNFSRLDEAKLKRVSIEDGIESTLALLQGDLRNRVEVVKDFAAVPDVLCFASQLNQVFMNLLSNAAQAIEGSGVVRISIQLGSTHPSLGQMVEIKIKDSGPGISAEHLPHVFDPFFTTKAVGKGTGLGLSISYEIIQRHGGELKVDSVLGQGAEFTISIPVNGPPRPVQGSVESAESTDMDH